ncbi:MAG: ATP-binding protein [Pseudomonadales bacterium]|nr:ATP-binding protein [Pseudomonadales bacterium]NRA14446.1 ATP-binding protein [Oceanospirillaceae bacterium]
MAKTEFQGLTARTRKMLAANENLAVDFKREVSGVKSSDFVAFANATDGGTLLLGVDEYTSDTGLQRGRVVGCSVDDKARLALVNKALECTPSIEVHVYVENLKQLPIMRIEIPANQHRPFCNSRGEYSIRSQGRNRALYPSEMLNIFLEAEAELFYHRFKGVATKLETQVNEISGALNTELMTVSASMEQLERQLKMAFGRIGQLTDSSKKRSRNLLHNVQDNQLILANLERAIAEDASGEQHKDRLQLLEEKIDNILKLLADSGKTSNP